MNFSMRLATILLFGGFLACCRPERSSPANGRASCWEKISTRLDEGGQRCNEYRFSPRDPDVPVSLVFAKVSRAEESGPWHVELLAPARPGIRGGEGFFEGSGLVCEKLYTSEKGPPWESLFEIGFLGAHWGKGFKRMEISHVSGDPGIGREGMMEAIIGKAGISTKPRNSASMLFQLGEDPGVVCITALW